MCPRLAQSNKASLRRRSDYLKTYKGRRHRTKFFTVYTVKNSLSLCRFGMTTPKTVGTAVVRNKLKRWGREFFRGYEPKEAEKGIDIHVFMGSNKNLNKEDYKNLTYADFHKQLITALQYLFKSHN